MPGARRGATTGAQRSLVLRIGLGVLVIGLVAAVIGTTVVGNDAAITTTTTTEAAVLSGPAAELADLLELRQGQAYHARYEGSSVQAASIVIETWQDGDGRVRQDQILSADGQGAHLVSLDGDDGAVRCTRVSEQEWSCGRAAPSEAAAADPLVAIRAQLAEGGVQVHAEQIDGGDARCFELDSDGTSSELCVRPATGIPVRITAGDTELRLVLLEETVDPAAFEPPGPVA